MTIECAIDCDHYVDLSTEMVASDSTELCVECRNKIHVGIHHYTVHEWHVVEDGEEIDLDFHRCCEECGDLALSLLALGYCWLYGDLRNTIKEINEYR